MMPTQTEIIQKRPKKLHLNHHPVNRHVVTNHVRSAERVETRVYQFVQQVQFALYQDYAYVIASFLVLLVLLELISVSTYIWSNESEVTWYRTTKNLPNKYNVAVPSFGVQAILCIFFSVEWVVTIIVAKDPAKSLTEFYSVVALCTCVPMNIVSIGATVSWGTWGGGYIPMFLRVWWAYRAAEWLVSIPQLALNAIRVDLFMQVFHLVCIMATCAGVFQLCESFSAAYISFFDCSYFMVVTFSTVGYGDIVPFTRLGRAALILIIGVAVVSLPGVLNSVNQFIAISRRFTTYQGNSSRVKHVVIIGNPISKDVMSEVVNEFFCGTRSLRPVNIVFMCPEGFDDDVKVFAKDPWWARKLTLIQGDVRSREDLVRAKVSSADALFILLNRNQPSSRGDMDVIQQMWTVNNYTSAEVPVYALMKRPNMVNVGTGTRDTTVLELEEMKFNLIGQSIVRPGIIPMLVNLVRSFDDEATVDTVSGLWVNSYYTSRSNEMYAMRPPRGLLGVCFLTLVAIMKKRYGATVIGVASNNRVVLNPKRYVLTGEDEILYIAPDDLVDDSAIDDAVVTSGDRTMDAGMLAALFPENGSPRIATRKCSIRESRGLLEEGPRHDPDIKISPHQIAVYNVSQNPAAANFVRTMNLDNHIVFLELSSTLELPSLSPEEITDGDHSQCKDLWDIFYQIKRDDPSQKHEIIILARLQLSPAFLLQWQSHGYKPLIFVEGCGAVQACLDLLSLPTAHTVIILSSSAGSFELGDTVISLVHHNVRQILERHSVTRHVPIIVELDGVGSMHHFPPSFKDANFRRDALDDFTMVPKYISGEAICSTMLDTALYQTYNNKYIIETMKRLVTGLDSAIEETSPLYRRTPSRLRSEPVTDIIPSGGNKVTTEEIFNALLEKGHVMVGLYRRTNGAFGFMLTNPNFENENVFDASKTLIEPTDVVHYLE